MVGCTINTLPNDLYAPSNGRNIGTGEFTNLVGRAVANYLVTDRFNVYASVARGIRPAVVNVLVVFPCASLGVQVMMPLVEIVAPGGKTVSA